MQLMHTPHTLALKTTPQLPLMLTVALLLRTGCGQFGIRQAYTPWWKVCTDVIIRAPFVGSISKLLMKDKIKRLGYAVAAPTPAPPP